MKDKLIGYAVCDICPQATNLSNALIDLGEVEVIELQKESNIWNIRSARNLLSNYMYLSIHSPNKDIDLSSPERTMQKHSYKKTIKTMDLANRISADALILHPINNQNLSPEKRIQHRDVFLNVWKNILVPHYNRNRHKYTVCIENIEYPKYPATLEELSELQKDTSITLPTSLTLDIAHIWNTRRILIEQQDLFNAVGRPQSLKHSLFQYVTEFISKHNEDIELYHMANFGEDPIRTHDPITDGNINPELKKILSHLKNKPIILEIYEGFPHSLIESKKVLIGEMKDGN
jgi:endonuclease IV